VSSPRNELSLRGSLVWFCSWRLLAGGLRIFIFFSCFVNGATLFMIWICRLVDACAVLYSEHSGCLPDPNDKCKHGISSFSACHSKITKFHKNNASLTSIWT
jgi:hypothetical protein